jgi:tRNA-specific 2-thiouridylase
VVIAMSGGVDSSVAAALLLEAGYRVEGASLRMWDAGRADDRICSNHRAASSVARHLGIAHSVIDRRDAFERRVVIPFVVEYRAGRTPNPCVACNSEFKLGWLLDWALARGAERVATGHYARLEARDGRVRLRRGVDPMRDQSYFLFSLSARQLEHAAFPLGGWRKDDVRRRAAELGLPVAEKPDSQDLCFGDPAALVRMRGAGGEAGDVVDECGRVLGRHRGIEGFTVGQRRGIGVASSSRLYVQSIDAPASRVVVGARVPHARALVARDWSWIGEPPAASDALAAQVRYRHPPTAARVTATEGRSRVRVDFDRAVAAVAPGQAVVVYRGDEVAGGGWIERALPVEGDA